MYAHLIAAMWMKHGSAFITGALYYGSQSIVKNITTTILHLQLLDRNHQFYILKRTNQLEVLFGDCCTQDHNQNSDILQLSERLSVSSVISSIFE